MGIGFWGGVDLGYLDGLGIYGACCLQVLGSWHGKILTVVESRRYEFLR